MNLHFLYSWILILLPLPWLCYRFLPRLSLKTPTAFMVPFFRYLIPIWRHQHMNMQNQYFYGLYFLWILLLLAAARPIVLGDPIHIPRQGRDILMLVDISGSMQIADMSLQGKPVDRLTIVKDVAKKFIATRKGDRIGLILFGSHAYWQAPLTYDLKTLQWLLDDATIGLAGTETALGDALGLGLKKWILSNNNDAPKNRVMLLLTDGANNTGNLLPLTSAELAAKHGIRIYTIGLGADRLVVESLFGTQQEINPSRDLDEKTLKKIATITGGLFYRAKDPKALADIYEEINALEPVETDKAIYRSHREYYHWPLALFWLLSLGGLSRRLWDLRKNTPLCKET